MMSGGNSSPAENYNVLQENSLMMNVSDDVAAMKRSKNKQELCFALNASHNVSNNNSLMTHMTHTVSEVMEEPCIFTIEQVSCNQISSVHIYTELCNERRGLSLRLNAWATQQHRSVNEPLAQQYPN